MYPSYNTNVESGFGGISGSDPYNSFSEKAVRMGFLRKVYSIVSLQLVITLGFVIIFSSNAGARDLALKNFWLVYVAIGASFVSLITLTCCGMARSFPCNLIMLGVFTLAESLMVGFISATKEGETILLAVAVTAIIVIALTIFAFQTKIDFTAFSGVMLCVLLVFVLFGFVMMFFPSKTGRIVYAALGTLIFSIYLVIDTQSLVGGDHKYQLSPEDYVTGALIIYMDIIRIFIYVLELISSSRE